MRAAGPSCAGWNTADFFRNARAADVARCLETQKVNARDKNCWTPLHAAAAHSKSPAVVETLLDAGADPAAKSNSDKTPWEYAKETSSQASTGD